MTKHFRTITFHGAGNFCGVLVSETYDRWTTPWTCLREAMAAELALSEDDLETFKAYWGGDYGDDDGAELVTFEGRLIGAINRQLTSEEFALISSIPHFADVRKTTDAERATPALRLAAE